MNIIPATASSVISLALGVGTAVISAGNIYKYADDYYSVSSIAKIDVTNSDATGPIPSLISVNPASGSWTTTPQNLAVSSSGSTIIYYTMVNTTDTTTPADPRDPTSTDNDGSITVSGGSGTFQLYGSAGFQKRSKLKFRGYNSAGAGPVSSVYSYSIDLRSSPVPGAISVSPASGSWTTTPQNLSVSSSNSTIIYYTMVNTTDGSTPADPREPTSSDNDGSITVSGGSGTFQLYGAAGLQKQSKLKFRGYNSAGAGPASGVYSYSIDLSPALLAPEPVSVNPSSGFWTSSPVYITISSSNATAIYGTLTYTTDGSTPADPPDPTPYNYWVRSLGPTREFPVSYPTPCELKFKMKFRAYNMTVEGPVSEAYSYTLDQRIIPPAPTW